ncbi:DUF6362 family protein [Sansalvadorimonas verongulae]|uniref:DUF6362 family protein n=1 Tax=Sansalvadorimonas verongulae TaxID=2172824 RepID=UPI0012BCE923|nr:DUF6362 family protein [Sansalvadorimonas verongulae]MTI13022.1 helix-turn-helix domain-containing protein [Sansalvadorimonas verongulae]
MTPEIDELANRYREAWFTAKRLPTGIQLGHGSSWPEMRYDHREQVRRAEREVIYERPTAEQEERLVECINWLRPLTVEERQLVWMRAAQISWRDIMRRTGTPRTTVQRQWHKALLTISLHKMAQGVDGS